MLIVFVFFTADIDEKSIKREKPEELVMALVEVKVWQQTCNTV